MEENQSILWVLKRVKRHGRQLVETTIWSTLHHLIYHSLLSRSSFFNDPPSSSTLRPFNPHQHPAPLANPFSFSQFCTAFVKFPQLVCQDAGLPPLDVPLQLPLPLWNSNRLLLFEGCPSNSGTAQHRRSCRCFAVRSLHG